MIKGKYIGHIEILKNKTSLIREMEISKISGCILAQFDDPSLPHKYIHNWQVFGRELFEIIEENKPSLVEE